MKKNLIIRKITATVASIAIMISNLLIPSDSSLSFSVTAEAAASSCPSLLPLPDISGMSQRDAVITLAKSQIGYKAGSGNLNIFTGKAEAWCAGFAIWLYNSVGLSTSQYGNGNKYCPTWVSNLKSSGMFAKRGTYTPKRGDLVMFDFNLNGVADHTGVVSEDSDGYTVKTIEGNFSTKQVVGTRSFSTDWKYVLGYGKIAFTEIDSNVSKARRVIIHTNQDGGNCVIDVPYGWDGSEVLLQSCSYNGGYNQIFELYVYDSNYYYIKNSYNDMVWNINGNPGDSYRYSKLQTFPYYGGYGNEIFGFFPIDGYPGYYFIYSGEGEWLILDNATGCIHYGYGEGQDDRYLIVSFEELGTSENTGMSSGATTTTVVDNTDYAMLSKIDEWQAAWNNHGYYLSYGRNTNKTASGKATVKALQEALNYVAGESLQTDSILGVKTSDAIYRYQRSRGLSADRVVGSATWNKLMDDAIAKATNS